MRSTRWRARNSGSIRTISARLGGAAVFSFLAFTVGAIIPLAPFLLKLGPQSVLYTAAFAGVALLVVGTTLSLFTGRGALWGGMRMLLIGRVSGAATYAIGTLLRVSLD